MRRRLRRFPGRSGHRADRHRDRREPCDEGRPGEGAGRSAGRNEEPAGRYGEARAADDQQAVRRRCRRRGPGQGPRLSDRLTLT